jgi:hypothetical protein
MDWLKRDPFAGGLALATAVLVLVGLYFAYSTHSAFSEQTENFSTNTALVGRLQSARPFPNEENLRAVSGEVDDAKSLIDMLSTEVNKQAAPLDASLTSQQFQDSLNSKVGGLIKLAADTGTVLPEDFYLGFGEYRTQPPSAAAAPLLGQQLESIANIASILIKAGVKEIVSLNRQPLPIETAEEAPSKNDAPTSVFIAPFDIIFVSDQTVFRDALAAIITATPVVFVRLVSVANSQPTALSKSAGPTGEPATGDAPPGQIPVLFGKETLQVNMRLASVSASAPTKQP